MIISGVVYDTSDNYVKKGRSFVNMFSNIQLEKLDLNRFFDLLNTKMMKVLIVRSF